MRARDADISAITCSTRQKRSLSFNAAHTWRDTAASKVREGAYTHAHTYIPFGHPSQLFAVWLQPRRVVLVRDVRAWILWLGYCHDCGWDPPVVLVPAGKGISFRDAVTRTLPFPEPYPNRLLRHTCITSHV